MKHLWFTLLVCLGIGATVNATAQKADDPFVHCLILDKTLSMKGHGGKDIWNDVQSYCVEWVDGVSTSSTILFFTYDKELFGPQVFEIKSEADKQKVKDAINKVKVDGRFTWIATNLDKVIKYAYSNYQNHNKRFYLITDGKEEQPESSFRDVLKNYSGERGDYDHLYYVDLNDSADQNTREALAETEGADIGKGFAKFVTARPEFSELNYVIGQTKTLEQRFIITNGEVLPELSFNLQIEKVNSVGGSGKTPNISINPSMEIVLAKLTKVEGGKYRLTFDLSFLNNSECECDIYVKLVGVKHDDYELAFSPSSFCIKAKNMPPPPPEPQPEVDTDGWK